jgi:TonB-dependent receptor
VKNKFTTKHLILFFLFLPTMLFASGKIKGVVSDSVSKEPLVGANLILENTSLGAASDIEGSYSILSVPAGKYKIKCSYIGYLSKEVNLTISDNSSIVVNFALGYDTLQGKEVVITAQAVGQVAAINQQITSNKIINVISEQKIKELPDANAAEALGRLPGISIVRSGGEANQIMLRGLNESNSSITLDGTTLSPTDADSRGVDLSTIAQGSLSGIAVTKAITSDMDGQAIAGSVNFVTKTAPETRTIEATAQGSYSGLDNTYNQYNFYGNYGERFFNNLLGVQLFGNIEQRDRSSENYNATYDQALLNNTRWGISDFNIQYTPETRRRRGGRILLDLRTPDGGVIKLDGDINRTERRLSIIGRDYPVEWASPTYTFTGQEINTNILSLALQGENNALGWQINWNLAFTQSSTDVPYNYSLEFVEPSTLDSAGNVLSGMKTVPASLRQGPFQALIPYAVDNFSYAFLNYANIRKSNSLDFQRTASVDIKRDYNFSDLSGVLKFGGKYTDHYHRKTSDYVFAPYYNGTQVMNSMQLSNGSIVPKDWAAYGFANLKKAGGLILMTNFIENSSRNLYSLYSLNPLIDKNLIRNWYDISINVVDPNSKPGNIQMELQRMEQTIML